MTLITTKSPSDGGGFPILGFFGSTAWELFAWAGLGWFIGYLLPLIRGGNGAAKATWIFIAATANFSSALIWSDAHDWGLIAIQYLELLVFLLVTTVIVCDLRELSRAGLSPAAWLRVHNWRFVATWSATLIVAIGTIATIATSTADLSQQLTGTSPSGNSSQHP